LQLEAVNGVPVAVKHEAVAAVKEEFVVTVRVELKWSHPLCYGLTFDNSKTILGIKSGLTTA
jgi:hypothetical protein